MVDNVRTRRAIRECLAARVITVGSGSAEESDAIFVPLAFGRLCVPYSKGRPILRVITNPAEIGSAITVECPVELSPRTAMSIASCVIASRDPTIMAGFPYFAAAAAVQSVSTLEAHLRYEDVPVVPISGSPPQVKAAADAATPDGKRSPTFGPTSSGAESFAMHDVVASSRRRVPGFTVAADGAQSPGRSSRRSARLSSTPVLVPSLALGGLSQRQRGEDGGGGGDAAVPSDLAASTSFGLDALAGSSDDEQSSQQLQLLWCVSPVAPQTRTLDRSVTGFTFWSPHRLAKLLLMLPTPAACKGAWEGGPASLDGAAPQHLVCPPCPLQASSSSPRTRGPSTRASAGAPRAWP